MRRVFALVMALGLVLVGGLKAEAQWSAADPVVDDIMVQNGPGQTAIGFRGTHCFVAAAPSSGFGITTVEVRFKRVYTATGQPGNLDITWHYEIAANSTIDGVLGEAVANFGLAGVKNAQASGQNEYFIGFFPSFWAVSPPSYTAFGRARAVSRRSPVGTSSADATIWFAP